MLEDMALYQYLFGVLAIGPHRELTSRVFKETRKACPACKGAGLRWTDETSYWVCATCEGTGGFWTISPAEVDARRSKILEVYPDAAAPTAGPGFLSGRVVHNLATGRMETLRDPAQTQTLHWEKGASDPENPE
jgi:hypothetical protein